MIIGLCDDDMENIEYMKECIIEEYRKKYDVSNLKFNIYNNSDKLIELYIQDKNDVVFIDIELENGKIGFDIARKLSKLKKNPAIVYMSSYEIYASKGYVCRPLGFVRKKYAAEDLELVMAEIVTYLDNECSKITFYNGSKSLEIDASSIYYVEVFDHELFVSTVDDEIQVRDQLTRHLAELENYGFIVVRRGVAVNYRYIKNICNYEITLVNGKVFKISKDRFSDVKRQWIVNRFM